MKKIWNESRLSSLETTLAIETMEGPFCEFKEKWKSAILNADFSARTAPFVPFVFTLIARKFF